MGFGKGRSRRGKREQKETTIGPAALAAADGVIKVSVKDPPWWRTVLEVIGLLAVVLSAFWAMRAAQSSAEQAKSAADQSNSNRTIPFEAARYAAQINALQEYSRAYGKFDSAVRLALVDMPFDISSASNVRRLTDDQMQANAIVGRRVLEAHAEYIAAASTNLAAIWSQKVQIDVGVAANHAERSARCFIIFGQHTIRMTHAYWDDIREAAAVACDGINEHKEHQEFIDTSKIAMDRMADELRYTQEKMKQAAE